MSRQSYQVAGRQAKISALFSGSAFVTDARRQSGQWHLWTDGQDVASAIYVDGKWSQGPLVTYPETNQGDRLLALAEGILRQKRSIQGVGLIFHIADEFAVCPVRTSYVAPDQHDEARLAILDEPATIIEESVKLGAAYRFVANHASRQGVAVRITERVGHEFSALVDPQSKIQLSMASAPLEMAALLPKVAATLDDPPSGSYIALLTYLRFTALAVYDEQGDLFSLTTLPHGTRVSPSSVASRIASEMKTHAIVKGAVLVVSAGGNVTNAVAGIVQDFHTYGATNAEFSKQVELHTLDSQELREACSKLGSVSYEDWFRPEFLWGQLDGALQSDASQNFSNEALRNASERITRSEAVFCVGARTAVKLGWLGAVGLLAWAGLSAFAAVRDPSWSVDPQKANAAAEKVERLSSLNRAASWWDGALQTRSAAWVNMEFISRLFPEGRGLVVTKAEYRMVPLMPDKKGSDEPPKKVGYTRTWQIEGMASAEGRPDQLTRAFVESALADAESATGKQLFKAIGTQRLTSNATSERQAPLTSAGVEYLTKFTLNIEVVVTASDAMALPAGKAPFPAGDNFEL